LCSKPDITIDGQSVGVVDQYGPGRDLPFDWSYRGLPSGRHVLELRLLTTKSDQSKDHYLNVRGFEVIEEAR
jgi:uncharacterized protein